MQLVAQKTVKDLDEFLMLSGISDKTANSTPSISRHDRAILVRKTFEDF